MKINEVTSATKEALLGIVDEMPRHGQLACEKREQLQERIMAFVSKLTSVVELHAFLRAVNSELFETIAAKDKTAIKDQFNQLSQYQDFLVGIYGHGIYLLTYNRTLFENKAELPYSTNRKSK